MAPGEQYMWLEVFENGEKLYTTTIQSWLYDTYATALMDMGYRKYVVGLQERKANICKYIDMPWTQADTKRLLQAFKLDKPSE